MYTSLHLLYYILFDIQEVSCINKCLLFVCICIWIHICCECLIKALIISLCFIVCMEVYEIHLEM